MKKFFLLSSCILGYFYLVVNVTTVIKQEATLKMLPSSVLPSVTILENFSGTLSFYGPDCIGCSGITSYGMDVRKGNVYYHDLEYGKVHIVAGDSSYPFGTILKISKEEKEVLAIVLDRGSAIGKDKRFTFDLLMSSEDEASFYGYKSDVWFTILRLGF